MSHSVRSHLKIEIDSYDEEIRRFIPGYEEMLEVAAEAVATIRPTLVLDLGAGTGALSEALLRRPEIGRVYLLDVDPEMLAVASRRLAGHTGRVEMVRRSYEESLPACDAIAASLALHHVPTLAAKKQLFARAHAAIRPGGILVNADATMPRDPAARFPLYREWADHMLASGIPEARAWRHFEEWAEEDTYLPLDEELAALEAVGFVAGCIWRRGPIGVVSALRP